MLHNYELSLVQFGFKVQNKFTLSINQSMVNTTMVLARDAPIRLCIAGS